jgi:hypothetical protein
MMRLREYFGGRMPSYSPSLGELWFIQNVLQPGE